MRVAVVRLRRHRRPTLDGRTRLIALEPNTTRFGWGLAEAKRNGAHLLTLQPGEPVIATVRLHGFNRQGRWRASRRTGARLRTLRQVFGSPSQARSAGSAPPPWVDRWTRRRRIRPSPCHQRHTVMSPVHAP